MSILADILAHKRAEIAQLDLNALKHAAAASPMPRDFLAALQSARSNQKSKIALIAELKRASPSRGLLVPHLSLLDIAEIYAANGATAFSVLTDEKFFLGHLKLLNQLSNLQSPASRLPRLRKDFLIHPAQLYQSRAAGAEAVLLIAAALSENAELAELHALALELGLTPLVEVHTLPELERVLRVPNVKLIGINNRDLATFTVSLDVTAQLRPHIPSHITVVSESGIFTAAHAQQLAALNVHAILVGEALVTAGDIGAKMRELLIAD
jgi:indole-3-glycerol phosphate synthase